MIPISSCRTLAPSIEPLEARIAPAAVFVNATTATYNDNDGDHVTVHFTKPVLTNGMGGNLAAVFTFNAAGYLSKLDLTAAAAPDGTGITFTVAKVAGGDGLANVGYLNSTGHDLGTVTVKGDLGQIDAGDATTATPGVKTLTVRSLGRLGTDTQTGGSLQSDISGALSSLVVAGDVKDVFIKVTGGGDGTIGALTIGGSLIGGAATDSGRISTGGATGVVKIGRDLQGGTGVNSGSITSGGELGNVTIGGSVLGGSAVLSGSVLSNGAMGAIKIGHDMQGGSGGSSGTINPNGKLGSITIGGSLLGGSASSSGAVISNGSMGAVKIGHDVQGGSGVQSGYIQPNGDLASVTVGGSLLGGTNTSAGQISGNAVGAVKIGHDVKGGSGIDTGFIHAITFVSVSVGGSLIGGSNVETGKISSNGAMGPVKIGHDVRGGSGNSSGMISSTGTLASVTIGGSLLGGSNTSSGEIFSSKDMGAVIIAHDFIGGSITGAASLDSSGLILSSSGIASVTIGGSIISGLDTGAGSLLNNASIRADDALGSLTVTGSLIGHGDVGNGASPVVISARGQAVPLPMGATADLAIGKITVGGRVEFAYFLAGYNSVLGAVNGDAQIGAVKVGGDWTASNLVAGVKNLGADNAAGGSGANADNVNYGDSHDFSIGVGNVNIIAKIASITIAGQVFGTPNSTSMTDHFGFVAAQIGALKIGGNTIVLAANLQAVGETTDVAAHKV